MFILYFNLLSLVFTHTIHYLELYFPAVMKGKKSVDYMREMALQSSKEVVPTA